MPYNVSRVNYHTVNDNGNYFLDSNIWLIVLQPKINPSSKDKEYRKLFEKILANNKCKIVVPALVLSEIINRILREVHMMKFYKKELKKNPSLKLDSQFYKNKFRPSEDFHIAYNLICDEIKTYHTSIVLINDSLGIDFKFKHILSNPPQGLDFNDYFYYNICKKRNYILVTTDKDFWVEGIQILTLSQTLLDKYDLQKV